jgi:hypothetical protein
MSVQGLNALVGRACISDKFRAGLMNGRRPELIRLPEFEVEPDEARALLAIKAETFAEFAAAVERLVDQRKSHAAWADSQYVVSVRWPSSASTGAYFTQSH